MSKKLEHLFQPIKIGTMELPNRIVMSAVTTLFDLEDSDRFINFYVERAKGGAGLIILGAYQTLYPGRRGGTNRVNLCSDRFVPKLREWIKTLHSYDCKVAAQLATFPYASLTGLDGTPEEIGPSAILMPRMGTHPAYSLAEYVPPVRALTVDEIHIIQEAVADAAVRARDAGFDALDLQCASGNLFNRFLTPITNTRTDQYGGSIENRMRFYTETVAAIKRKIGSDFPITSRISGDDLLPHGLTISDWQKLAPHFEKAGVNALNTYPGWQETREPRWQMCVPRGGFIHIATAIKEMVSIPVIYTLRINDPVMADRFIAEGKTDMVTMTRPCIADPDMPKKAKEGRLDDIVMCTGCCYCYDTILAGKPMACSVNARVGKEIEYQITPAKQPKKVFVIGGGPGGMEAARVAALRGHKITLFDKNSKLGGQILTAILPPYKDEWNTVINYHTAQLDKLKVAVKLNKAVTAADILDGKPDAVVIATGSVHCIPNIPGINGKNVATATEVLTGQKQTGHNVVIIGGGSVGCETAEFLAEKGKKVTIIEMLRQIGADYGPINRLPVIDRLVKAAVRLETGLKAMEITEKGVKVTRINWFPEFFAADTVIIAVGMVPVDNISQELQGKVPVIHKIGDCGTTPGIKKAIESGFVAGSQI